MIQVPMPSQGHLMRDYVKWDYEESHPSISLRGSTFSLLGNISLPHHICNCQGDSRFDEESRRE